MNEELQPSTVPEEAARPTTTERHVLSGSLFRARGRRVTFAEERPPEAPSPPEPVRRPAKVAQLLALAHHIQAAIDRGEVADRATVARRLGLTRTRVCQRLDLCLLAPDLHEAILGLEAVDGAERTLRGVVRAGSWEGQRTVWAVIAMSVAHEPRST